MSNNTKLYNVPRETKVKLMENPGVPVGSKQLKTGDVLMFDHVDGMYSYCITEDGEIVHPAAWTKVEIIKE